MFQRTKLSTGIIIAFGATMLAGTPVLAQETQRVEITGSAIKRIDAESAVPVVILKKEEILRSGATSVVDLLQRLPAVQGSTGESASVGGETFGFSGISIHDLGEARTLVLLNGHRLALFGGQTLTGFAAGFDLNAIPVSAIERVEVLTDGASALYGADAVAGVVNFITKTNYTDGDVSVGYSSPKGGAKEKRVSITKGFGNLDTDGFNAMISLAHDERTKLNSIDRSFAKSGRVFFSQDGKNYRFQQYSASPIPANVVDDNGNLINPYLVKNGSCPDKTFHVVDGSDNFCGFDFVGELEIYPVRERNAAFGSFNLRLGEHDLFANALVSQTKQTSRIAPVPGSISIPASSPLFAKYLAPIGITQDTVAFYRVYDLGKRTSNDQADFLDLSIGSKGTFKGWDYEAVATHSESKVAGNIQGYPGALALKKVRASGLLDPFVLVGQQSDAAKAALAAVNYNGYWNGGKSTLDTIASHGSTELMKLPAGPLLMAAGVNFNHESFASMPSLFAQGKLTDVVAGTLCDPTDPTKPCDQRFGDSATNIPYSANRNSYGIFGELSVPVMKGLDFSGSVRHDHYSDFGNADTAQLKARWAPSPDVLIRGSVGTGFHAPTVPQVAALPQPYGVTSDKYSCSADMATVAASLGAECRPGKQQYDQIAAGNNKILPEKSQQATVGFRIEPEKWLSMGADLWWVGINQNFGQLPEATVFGKPLNYLSSWTSKTDVGTGKNYLAFNAINLNLGNSYSTGLDLDFSAKAKTEYGELNSQLHTTYMIREESQQLKNGPYYSAIGDFGPNVGGVTFRYTGRWQTTLKTGSWTNTVAMNFKSGYLDATETADVLDASGSVTGQEDVRIRVPWFYTFDWQTQYGLNKSWTIVVGALNLFDRRPPFVLSTSGTNRGQQFGYDDRYYDSRGRTVYLNATYKF